MKVREIVLSLVCAAAAGSLLFFSCGKSDDEGGDGQEEQSSEGKDVTQAFTLKITGAQVEIPAGAFDAGSKVNLAGAAVPAEFQTNVDASVASVAISLGATDAAAAALPQAKVPLSITLDVNSAAALAAVEKKNENLCVIGRGQDNVLRLWRFAQLTVADNKVKFPAIWLGYYAALYCGADTFTDLAVVNAAGTEATVGGGGGAIAGYSCDYKATQGIGYCILYVGTAFSNADLKAKTKEACESAKGSFGDTACADAAVAGFCVFQHGTIAEFAWSYYTEALQQGQTAATVKEQCEKSTGAKWFDPGTYTPTPAADQTQLSTNTNTNTNTNTSTNTNTNTGSSMLTGHGCDWRTVNFYGYCMLYSGTAMKTPLADSNNQNGCTAQGGADAWSLDGCPTENVLGACVTYLGKKTEFAVVYYSDHLQGGQTPENVEAACDDPAATWMGGATYTPTPDASQID